MGLRLREHVNRGTSDFWRNGRVTIGARVSTWKMAPKKTPTAAVSAGKNNWTRTIRTYPANNTQQQAEINCKRHPNSWITCPSLVHERKYSCQKLPKRFKCHSDHADTMLFHDGRVVVCCLWGKTYSGTLHPRHPLQFFSHHNYIVTHFMTRHDHDAILQISDAISDVKKQNTSTEVTSLGCNLGKISIILMRIDEYPAGFRRRSCLILTCYVENKV